MNFALVERDYIRSRILADFEWAHFSTPSPINPLTTPLARARIAMVTTAGVHPAADPPFNLASKTGDPSYREIPTATPLQQLRLSHVGYNTRKVSQDINCVFPLQRLQELAEEGIVGSVNPRHFSFMGYIPIVDNLLAETAPAVAHKLRSDAVDLVLLIPA